jgi:hypothetical protein
VVRTGGVVGSVGFGKYIAELPDRGKAARFLRTVQDTAE